MQLARAQRLASPDMRRRASENTWPPSSVVGRVQRLQWASGLYIPGRYHHQVLTPTPAAVCTIGSDGTIIRLSGNRSGELDVAWFV